MNDQLHGFRLPTEGEARKPSKQREIPFSLRDIRDIGYVRLPDNTPRPAQQTFRVPNVMFLLKSVLVVAVIGPAAYFWHSYQVVRQAQDMLKAAISAETGGQWKRSAALLRTYLRVAPDDPDAQIRLAQVVDKGASSINERQRAITEYSKALDRAPDRHDLRLRLAELQLEHSPEGALASADRVLSSDPGNIDALRLSAQALDQRMQRSGDDGQMEKVVNAYRLAVDRNPGRIDIVVRLADLYRKHSAILADRERVTPADIEQRADGLVNAMVQAGRNNGDAFLARYSYRRRHRLTEQRTAPGARLDDDLSQVLQLDPRHVEARLLAAESLLLDDPAGSEESVRQRFAEARAQLQAAVDLSGTNDPRAAVALGDVLTLESRWNEAATLFETAKKANSLPTPVLDLRLCRCHLALEQWELARRRLDGVDETLVLIRGQSISAARADLLAVESQLLRAEWLLAPNNPERNEAMAANTLRSACQRGDATPLGHVAFLALAQCQMRLGRWDLAMTAYRGAVRARPKFREGRLGVIECLRQLGRYSEAAEECHSALTSLDVADRAGRAEVYRRLAGILAAQQLLLPEGRREWSQVDDALAMARDGEPESWATTLIEIDSLRVRGPAADRQKATDKLNEWFRSMGDNERALEFAEETYRALGEEEKATAASERRRAARASQGGERQGTPIRIGGDDLATRLNRLAKRQPGDLFSRWWLFHRALATHDDAVAQKREAEMIEIEGESAGYGRLASVARGLADPRSLPISDARNIVEAILDERPDWAVARTLAAHVAEAQGRWDEALSYDREAYRLGDRRPTLIARMLALYALRGRESAAHDLLHQLPDVLVSRPEILPLAIPLWSKGNTRERAADVARQALSNTDPESYVLLGVALASDQSPAGKEEARRAMRRAVDIDPADVACRLAWLATLTRGDIVDAAPRLLDELAAIRSLVLCRFGEWNEGIESLVLARSTQCDGDLTSAERFYRWASLRMGNADAAKALPRSALIVATDSDSLPTVWEQAVNAAPPAAQRTLALLRAADPRGVNPSIAGTPLADQYRWAAVARAISGGQASLTAAVELYSKLTPTSLTRGDHLALARWNARLGQPAAKQHLTALIDGGLIPEHAQEAIRLCLSLGLLSQAKLGLEQWGRQEPAARGLFAARMRLAILEKDVDRAKSLAKEHATTSFNPDASAPWWTPARESADWLSAMGMTKEAEALLRSSASEPTRTWALADWLSTQPGRQTEAVELCRPTSEAGQETSLWVAARCASAGPLSPATAQRLEAALEKAGQGLGRRSAAALNWAALWRHSQGQTDQAIALARRALQTDPELLECKNNLALLLAAPGARQGGDSRLAEAKRQLDLLVGEVGPEAELLDSLGLVAMGSSGPASALPWLEAAWNRAPNQPSIAIHLASARARLGQTKDAKALVAPWTGTQALRLSVEDREALLNLSR